MASLTEPEIFECLSANFRLAAEACDDLAVLPAKGPTYRKLRQCLKLIEGAARQAAYWRQDARWLLISRQMGHAHKRAGDWLRGDMIDDKRVKLAPIQVHHRFRLMAEKMRIGHASAETCRTAATGRVGMILPKPQAPPHRDTRPVQVLLPPQMRKTQGGILIPPHVSLQ